VPARRSRTNEWRRCLREILDRKGAIEIAVLRRYEDGEPGSHLIWRVHLLDIRDHEIVVEQPAALGRTIHLQPGVELVAIISIGQNRWMFTSRNLGHESFKTDRHEISALRIGLPDRVQRCQRRSYYRVNTASLSLPRVEMWPLLDPKTVLLAERANELQFETIDTSGSAPAGEGGMKLIDEDVMPDVGPRFSGSLVNVGGGGMGIVVEPDEAQALQRHKVFWLRFQLDPEVSTPICATGKLVHTHIQSNQATYAGISFDFTFNPGHHRFVVDQIARHISVQQRMQMERSASRRSA
jgi:c-di-GMP-binding flagellar brake protein YcgR